MPNLLHLDSSSDLVGSRSRAISRTFADSWRARGGEYTVTYRDLHLAPIPHLPDPALHWAPRLRPEDADPPASAEHLQEELIAELLAADALVIGAPMYNYSMASTLKAWIDYIHVPGITAPFDTDEQPLAGRPAVIITARGASYDEGSATAGFDHAVPPLQIILGTALGMAVSVITASLTLAETVPALADGIDRSRAELGAAHEQAADTARSLLS